MELYIVRHGESVGNTKRGFVSGRKDKEGLTIKGKSQIIRTSFYLKDKKITKVLTSPIQRTLESAYIIGTLLNVSVEKHEFLNELDHGLTGGNYWWDTKHLLPSHWFKDGKREDFKTPYPDGESFADLAQRVWEGYKNFLLKTSAPFVIMTHQAIIATLVFCASVGNPHKHEDEYLNFIHSFFTPNGGIIKMSGAFEQINAHVIKNLSPIDHSNSSVRFYIAGILTSRQGKITSHRISSVSKNAVYKIHTPQEYIFKILSDQHILASQRLINLYSLLEEKTKIPSPHIIHYDESSVFFPYPLMLQDYKKGVELSVCLKSHTHSSLGFLSTLLTALEKLHSLKLEGVSKNWFPQNWVKYISSEITNTKSALSKFKLGKDKKTHILTQLSNLKKYIESHQYVETPIHADLSPNNIIVHHEKKECSLTGILDFDRVRFGDPLWDIVYFYGWLERINKKAALEWKTLVFKKKSYDAKIFELYRTLFHAWTVRDMFDYKKDGERKKAGLLSLALF